jgi:NADH dehydrogenase [ubiquinone] 1 alpha subcomplex assembly factor 7
MPPSLPMPSLMPSLPAEAAPGSLLAGLGERIRRDGPMRVDAYMQACHAHPLYGYRHKVASIGAAGDFVTAPEISQVFGELVGLWSAVVWESMGRPAPLRLVELGPGRGTLMRDALRAGKAIPQFLAAISVHLVEVSEPMRRLQRAALPRGDTGGAPAVTWHDTLAEVPAGPAIVIANELLDALPIRQLVRAGQAWRERVVALDPRGHLTLTAGEAVELETAVWAPEGAILELRAGEDELLAALAARTAPCAALLIDYGPAGPAFGDTLQAVRGHAYADPLTEPGAADLTAHVQFAALAEKARAAGLAADGPITQAEFLGRLGIVERTARLMAANPARAAEIEAATQRLMSPGGMGQLFKVMAVRTPALPAPPPFG